MSAASLGDRFIAWAQAQESIRALTQIGSRARGTEGPGPSDAGSDWDFQIVVDNPALFEARAQVEAALGSRAIAYTVRGAALAAVKKLTAVFPEGGLDIVLMPTRDVEGVKMAVAAGKHMESPMAMMALGAMSSVLLGGYKILKGEEAYGDLYRLTATKIPPPRVADAAAIALAEGFVCDYLATKRLIARGELAAGQRWLHLHLSETLFKLHHELRTRQGKPSFPDARRLDLLDSDGWTKKILVNAPAAKDGLLAGTEQAASTCRELMKALVGEQWHWPTTL